MASRRATRKGRGPRDTSDIKKIMQANADAYLHALFNPFASAGARLPEATPYPSSIAKVADRQPGDVIDTAGPPNFRGSYNAFTPDLTNMGNYWWKGGVGSTPTAVNWGSSVHPNQASVQANAKYIRAVAMGVRVTNTAPLLNRGAVLYCAVAPTLDESAPNPAILEELKTTTDVVSYDLADIGAEGVTVVWLPITSQASIGEAGVIDPTMTMYIEPSFSSPLVDSAIYIWTESNFMPTVDLHFETIIHYEFIPDLLTEHLFDRQSVMSSPANVAEAYEKAGRQGASTTVHQQHKGKTRSAGNILMKNLRGAVGTAGSQLANMAKKQVPSMFSGLTRTIAEVLSREDLMNHRVAVWSGRADLSPRRVKALRGLSKQDYFLFLSKAMTLPKVPSKIHSNRHFVQQVTDTETFRRYCTQHARHLGPSTQGQSSSTGSQPWQVLNPE